MHFTFVHIFYFIQEQSIDLFYNSTNQVIPSDMVFPWHARIFVRNGIKVAYQCGGSLVTKVFVLTAAHCVNAINTTSIWITIGNYSSSVHRTIVHPLYFGKVANYGSDIALLALHRPPTVQFAQFIRPVDLDWEHQDVAAKGFVATIEGGLKIVEIPIVAYAECLAGQRRDFWKFITFTSFCAGWTSGIGGGVCNGDSGSGLVVRDTRTGRWLLKVMRIFKKVNRFKQIFMVSSYRAW